MEEQNKTVKVLFTNNVGTGFSNDVEIPAGTSVGKFFKDNFGDARPENFTIRCNKETVPSDYVLKDGDRLTVIPSKVTGALAA